MQVSHNIIKYTVLQYFEKKNTRTQGGVGGTRDNENQKNMTSYENLQDFFDTKTKTNTIFLEKQSNEWTSNQ